MLPSALHADLPLADRLSRVMEGFISCARLAELFSCFSHEMETRMRELEDRSAGGTACRGNVDMLVAETTGQLELMAGKPRCARAARSRPLQGKDQ